MKAKHIISAVLTLVLPLALTLGFGTLTSHLNLIAHRTYTLSYGLLSQSITAITVVAYLFWLSFIMRTKNRKSRILLICCTMAVALFLLISSLGYWLLPFPYTKAFVTTTALICGLANLFAGIYMLFKLKKQNTEL